MLHVAHCLLPAVSTSIRQVSHCIGKTPLPASAECVSCTQSLSLCSQTPLQVQLETDFTSLHGITLQLLQSLCVCRHMVRILPSWQGMLFCHFLLSTSPGRPEMLRQSVCLGYGSCWSQLAVIKAVITVTGCKFEIRGMHHAQHCTMSGMLCLALTTSRVS